MNFHRRLICLSWAGGSSNHQNSLPNRVESVFSKCRRKARHFGFGIAYNSLRHLSSRDMLSRVRGLGAVRDQHSEATPREHPANFSTGQVECRPSYSDKQRQANTSGRLPPKWLANISEIRTMLNLRMDEQLCSLRSKQVFRTCLHHVTL